MIHEITRKSTNLKAPSFHRRANSSTPTLHGYALAAFQKLAITALALELAVLNHHAAARQYGVDNSSAGTAGHARTPAPGFTMVLLAAFAAALVTGRRRRGDP